jgi:hypothetical protein
MSTPSSITPKIVAFADQPEVIEKKTDQPEVLEKKTDQSEIQQQIDNKTIDGPRTSGNRPSLMRRLSKSTIFDKNDNKDLKNVNLTSNTKIYKEVIENSNSGKSSLTTQSSVIFGVKHKEKHQEEHVEIKESSSEEKIETISNNRPTTITKRMSVSNISKTFGIKQEETKSPEIIKLNDIHNKYNELYKLSENLNLTGTSYNNDGSINQDFSKFVKAKNKIDKSIVKYKEKYVDSSNSDERKNLEEKINDIKYKCLVEIKDNEKNSHEDSKEYAVIKFKKTFLKLVDIKNSEKPTLDDLNKINKTREQLESYIGSKIKFFPNFRDDLLNSGYSEFLKDAIKISSKIIQRMDSNSVSESIDNIIKNSSSVEHESKIEVIIEKLKSINSEITFIIEMFNNGRDIEKSKDLEDAFIVKSQFMLNIITKLDKKLDDYHFNNPSSMKLRKECFEKIQEIYENVDSCLKSMELKNKDKDKI